MKPSNYLAALILFFLPAISVELLTGDISLPVFLSPETFVLVNVTYGGALLLLRETVVRWNKGFTSVLLLAAGYGMLNEALSTKGFFDPTYYAVVETGLGGVGRLMGINVPWALNLSIFHATFSMIVPLMIVSVLFPGKERWIGNRLYSALFALLGAVTVFSFFIIALPPDNYHYNEGPVPIFTILVLMSALVAFAWKVPDIQISKWSFRPNAPLLFFVGFFFMASFFFLYSLLFPAMSHTSEIPALLYELSLLTCYIALPIYLIFKIPEPSPHGKLALILGLLLPIVVRAFAIGIGSQIAAVIVLGLIITGFVRSYRGAETRSLS